MNKEVRKEKLIFFVFFVSGYNSLKKQNSDHDFFLIHAMMMKKKEQRLSLVFVL